MRSDVAAVIAGGESLTVEFKRARGLNDRSIVEAVACMANGEGGLVLLGVEDDGTVSGVDPRHGDHTNPALIEAMILNRTMPSLVCAVSIERLDELDVVVIEVPAASITGTKDGVYRRRSVRVDGKPECVPYEPTEMWSRHFVLSHQDFADVVARGAVMSDLDPRELERLRTMASRPGADTVLSRLADEELCRALGVLRQGAGAHDEITLGGVLLFGRESALRRHLPNAESSFVRLDGLEVEENDIQVGPLMRVAEDFYARVQPHNAEVEIPWGLHRVAVQRVPNVALREAIANALVHRDYAERGMTRMTLERARLTVESPGGFPPGVSQENILTTSRPRSRTLADAFKRAGMVERTGRGVGRMYDALLRTGRSEPSFALSSDRVVSVTFETADVDVEMTRFIVSREDATQRSFSLDELRILHELRTFGSTQVADVVRALRLDEQRARSTLAALLEQGLVEVRGVGRGRRFHLSAAFYRLTEDPSAYIRVRGTEPLQHEQMVLNFVREFGKIRRSEAATLCMLDGPQATRLLQRMTSSGQLEQVGERRATYYVIAEVD